MGELLILLSCRHITGEVVLQVCGSSAFKAFVGDSKHLEWNPVMDGNQWNVCRNGVIMQILIVVWGVLSDKQFDQMLLLLPCGFKMHVQTVTSVSHSPVVATPPILTRL